MFGHFDSKKSQLGLRVYVGWQPCVVECASRKGGGRMNTTVPIFSFQGLVGLLCGCPWLQENGPVSQKRRTPDLSTIVREVSRLARRKGRIFHSSKYNSRGQYAIYSVSSAATGGRVVKIIIMFAREDDLRAKATATSQGLDILYCFTSRATEEVVRTGDVAHKCNVFAWTARSIGWRGLGLYTWNRRIVAGVSPSSTAVVAAGPWLT